MVDPGTRAALTDQGTRWAGRQVAPPPNKNVLGKSTTSGEYSGGVDAWGHSGGVDARGCSGSLGGARKALNWTEPAETKVSWAGPAERKVSWAGPAERKVSWAGPAEAKVRWAGPAETKESWTGPPLGGAREALTLGGALEIWTEPAGALEWTL